ncbi:MAG: hypothetical protein ACRDIX_09140 [Actinomycetota bacterium]
MIWLEELENRISRRRMLKRVGAGAAIAWSAPVLSSLRTPAFAQPYPGRCDELACAADCGLSIPEELGACQCFQDVAGTAHCTNNFFCNDARRCSTNDDCVSAFGVGFFCQTGTGCGGTCGQQCAPDCGLQFAAAAGEGGATNA